MTKCKCKKCGQSYYIESIQKPTKVVDGVILEYVVWFFLVDKKNPKLNKNGLAVSHC